MIASCCRPFERSNPMKCWTCDRWIVPLAIAITLTPGLASAQEADTLSISGTFHMHSLKGIVGPDLAAVFANGNTQAWSLTLYGVFSVPEYSYQAWTDEWGNIGY